MKNLVSALQFELRSTYYSTSQFFSNILDFWICVAIKIDLQYIIEIY